MSPHGIPIDLLDRLMIIRTVPYTVTDIMQILNIRASIESIMIDDEALVQLAQLGSRTSLRYGSPAHQQAAKKV